MDYFKENKGNKGITLIALVVSIIILLILAGISISMISGNNSLLQRATDAKSKTDEAGIYEQKQLAMLNAIMNKENYEYVDKYGNIAVIPEGFSMTDIEGENTINDGLVIIDSEGNEFVWIPIGDIKKEDGSIENITLGMYTFDENGEHTIHEDSNLTYLSKSFVEDTLDGNNTHAIDIEDFKLSVEKNRGYYIARYEARDATTTQERITESSEENKIIINSTNSVYRFITQLNAAKLCRDMYDNKNFTCDLANSYAWDTAIIFIQKFSKNKNYSNQTSFNNAFINTGTKEDVMCNIYDMASNCWEWVTTTCYSNTALPCTFRGGVFDGPTRVSSRYGSQQMTYKALDASFRPILYIK